MFALVCVAIPLFASWSMFSVTSPDDQALQKDREYYQYQMSRGVQVYEVPGIEAIYSSDRGSQHIPGKYFVSDVYGHAYIYEPVVQRVTHMGKCCACLNIRSAQENNIPQFIESIERDADHNRNHIFDVYGIALTKRPMRSYDPYTPTVVYSRHEGIDLNQRNEVDSQSMTP